jgi:4-hydroxybutyrate CoA-transferase
MPEELATIRDAVALVRTGDTVLLPGQAATLTEVSDALGQRADLHNIRVESMHWEGPLHHLLNLNIRHQAWFMSGSLREAATMTGRVDWNPMSLSAIPEYLYAYPPDVVFAHVAPPVDGHVSMGTNCDIMFAGLHAAHRARKTLVAVVNPMMPHTFGHLLPLSMFTHLVDINRQPFGHTPDQLNCSDASIAHNLASVVPNGATIAAGIGLPDKCVHGLTQHRGLRVWTEMMSDGVLRLIESGVVTGNVTTSFLIGSQALYTWMDNNPRLRVCATETTNNFDRLRHIRRFYAIVGATQIDLSGNVAAHCVPTPDGGYRPYSGRGGHCDLLRGSRYSDGGAGIVVMPSTAHGDSRLVPTLRVPVTTPGEYIDYVVTDKGATPNLRWMTASQRSRALEQVF